MMTLTATGKNYYRPDEVAKMFQVSVKTVYLWVDTGKMDGERIAGRTIRIHRDAIQKVIKPATE